MSQLQHLRAIYYYCLHYYYYSSKQHYFWLFPFINLHKISLQHWDLQAKYSLKVNKANDPVRSPALNNIPGVQHPSPPPWRQFPRLPPRHRIPPHALSTHSTTMGKSEYAPPKRCCVASDKLPDLSELQFPHLAHRDAMRC